MSRAPQRWREEAVGPEEMSTSTFGMPEERKPPTLKAGGLRASAELSLALQSAGAFDSYPDFAKLNTKCYKAARANTFNTPAPLVPTGRPLSPKSEAKSAQAPPPGPIRDLLEIFELGVARNMASFRNEIRDELQKSTDMLRKEVLTAMADTRGLVMLAEINQKIEQLQVGPVNVDLTPVVSECRECKQALDRHIEQNTLQVCDELRTMQQQAQRQNERRDGQHTQLETLLREADAAAAARSEAQLGATRGVHAALDLVAQEASRVEAHVRQHQDRVELALRQGAERQSSTSQMLHAVCGQLVSLMDGQRALAERCERSAGDILALRHEGEEHRARLLPSFESALSSQLDARQVNVDFGEVLQNIWTIQNAFNAEFPTILQEIARVQAALNVDFEFIDPRAAKRHGNHSSHVHKTYSSKTVSMETQAEVQAIGENDEEVVCFAPVLPTVGQGRNVFENRQSVLARTAAALMGKRRVRHYWAQTDSVETVANSTQTETAAERVFEKRKPRNTKISVHRVPLPDPPRKPARLPPSAGQRVFADSEQMKQKARQALFRRSFTLTDYYHTSGCAQRIATSPVFANITLLVILLNTLWLAVDADYNNAVVLIEANPLFIVMENAFCLFFTFEVCVRFASFKAKRYCLKDRWFIFDTILVVLNITETWIITIIVLAAGIRQSAGLGSFSVLRAFRTIKMIRISRMARLLRSIPELVILMKGIKAASRSVFVFFLLWVIIVYIYALVFRVLADERSAYFGSVPSAMNELFLEGVLPNHADFVNDVVAEHALYWPIIVSFVALASVTLMNMLVGVLVEVVSAIASIEKESIAVLALASDLREAMTSIGRDPDEAIAKVDFQSIITETEIANVIQKEGVDVVTLLDMTDSIYEELSPDESPLVTPRLAFPDLVELVLSMRGTNPAKVKDVKQQLRFFKSLMQDTHRQITASIAEEIQSVRDDLQSVQAAVLARLPDDDSSDDEPLEPRGGPWGSFAE